jgi:trimeric autotransporter adhesin
MSKLSSSHLFRLIQRCFLHFAIAIIAIACGGRSDEGLLPPNPDGGSLDGALRGDAARDASDDFSLDGFPDGTTVLPDGAIILPDGARLDTGGGTGPDDGGRLPDGGTARTLVRISVDPAVSNIGTGTPQQLHVTGYYSDNSTPVVLTAQVIYQTTAPGVATVNTNGLVTGVAAGTAIINIVKQPEGLTAEATINVSSATVVSLAVTPAIGTVGIGATIRFTATATLSNNTTQDVTALVNWSSDPAIASISGFMSPTPGLATGIAAGMTTIRATMQTGGVSGTATLTVTAARLVSIAITPANQVLPVGVTFSFKAAGTYDDGVVRDVTDSVQWQSSLAAVATISANGSGTTVAPGTTNITATLSQGGMMIVGTTQLTVTAATLVSIEITPMMSTVIVGGPTQQLVATGRYNNNTNVVLTASVAWSSTPATTATISNAAGTEGRVTGLAPGTAMITATLGGVTGTATVTVVAARLVSIAITPASPSVPKGANTQLTATGTYDTGQMLDVTTLMTWASSMPTIATISNAAGSNGQATGVALGTTQITATAPGGMPTASVTLTVTDAVPASIEVTPADAMVQVTRTQQMTATAVYTDGSRVNVTTQVTWSTGRAATATISNGAGSQGVATGVAAGTTTVTATWPAWSLMGTTNITVTPAIPTLITVAPATATIAVNATQAFTAVVIFDIGTQATVTGQCMWASSNLPVATMGTGNAAATATGRGGGMSNITCTYTAAGVTLMGSATLTVTPITLPVSINVTPDPVTVTTGGTAQLTAIVTYDNGSTATVTNQASWAVYQDAGMIASVSTLGNQGRGVVTGIAPGTTTVQASFVAGGITVYGTAVVTVEGTPTGLTLSPGVVELQVGQTQNYTVTVLYSDGNSRVIPANNTQTVCSSTDTGIANFQVMGMNRVATCLTEGTVTLSCTYTPVAPPGVTGTAQLDCASPVPIRIDIAPGNTTVALGQTVTYTATATYANGTMANITTNALTTWSSSNTAVAIVNNSGGTKGQANTLSQGMTTITVSFRGVMASVTLTVGPIQPIGLSITPTGGTLPRGSTTQYSSLLLMSDGTTQNVTQMATWTSSTPGGDAGPVVASVSNTGTRGVVTAVNAGSAQIRATYTTGGQTFTDQINVTVQ